MPPVGNDSATIEALTTRVATLETLAAAMADGVMTVPGVHSGNVTTQHPTVDGYAYCLYMGRVRKAVTSWKAAFVVSTAATTVQWAEAALCKSAAAPAAATDMALTLLGYTDISSEIAAASATPKSITIAAAPAVGDHLWLVLACDISGGTVPQYRANSIADIFSNGCHGLKAATRPSTMATPSTFSVTAGAVTPIWCLLYPQ